MLKVLISLNVTKLSQTNCWHKEYLFLVVDRVLWKDLVTMGLQEKSMFTWSFEVDLYQAGEVVGSSLLELM